MEIKRNYIVDSENRKIAVQIPIDEFNKIEEYLENHVLNKLIEDVKNEDTLVHDKALEYYNSLKKNVEK